MHVILVSRVASRTTIVCRLTKIRRVEVPGAGPVLRGTALSSVRIPPDSIFTDIFPAFKPLPYESSKIEYVHAGNNTACCDPPPSEDEDAWSSRIRRK